jgi:hypothetical protein
MNDIHWGGATAHRLTLQNFGGSCLTTDFAFTVISPLLCSLFLVYLIVVMSSVSTLLSSMSLLLSFEEGARGLSVIFSTTAG